MLNDKKSIRVYGQEYRYPNKVYNNIYKNSSVFKSLLPFNIPITILTFQIGFVFLLIISIVDNLPDGIGNKHGQEYEYGKLPIDIGKYGDKRHPYYEYYRRHDTFEYFIRQRLYGKAQPPREEIVFLHIYILTQFSRHVNLYTGRFFDFVSLRSE